ncbi:tartrate dehydrogenase [Acidobacteria bacterium AH-259-G07]|nr:tartrate dehydrogenase [Acidobacteria bacterium AH-259-G07]
MKTYNIAAIPGDGIGVEVIDEGIRVLESTALMYGFRMQFEHYPWGTEYYLKHGSMMPETALGELKDADAIYLGAVGDPRVPDNVTLGGLLLPIRQTFQQFANVRPAFLFAGVTSPLSGKQPGTIDCVVVRENTEGEYSQVGGRVHKALEGEVAVQTAVFTSRGTERIIRFAFDLATRRGKKRKVTSITKSNALGFGMALWDEIFEQVAKEYPEIQTESLLVDAACMDLIRRPEDFDVLVASNLFGDITSEITAAVTGSLGLAPSANINPAQDYPSMFEPVHGSAPDIAGKGIANPVAAILAGQMMLEFLGETELADCIYQAIAKYLKEGVKKTADLGGNATTQEATDEIIGLLGLVRDKLDTTTV